MSREFKVNNTRFSVVNRSTNGLERNRNNPRYNLMKFSDRLAAWVKVATCQTIAEGHEIAEMQVI